jgi:asparagine synthetase A
MLIIRLGARIQSEERTIDFLEEIVGKIYSVIKHTEFYVYDNCRLYRRAARQCFHTFRGVTKEYPTFLSARIPPFVNMSYFIIGIGALLDDGPHDGRAPDYDD